MTRRALITGIFGQDGSYLAEALVDEGFEVHGIARTILSPRSEAIRHHLAQAGVKPTLHPVDLASRESVQELVAAIQPHECYHLAAAHYAAETPAKERRRIDHLLFEFNVVSTLNLLEAISEVSPSTRFVLAGSCLMYDAGHQTPQSENLAYSSDSFYGVSKITAARLVALYRDRHGLIGSTAILYNHESPRRSESFVTKKIVANLVRVKKQEIARFSLGDLRAVKDWGYAPDYVRGMRLMALQDAPVDYVLSTGIPHTVEDFLAAAAEALEVRDWRSCVRVEGPPIAGARRVPLVGDSSAAQVSLGWSHAVGFQELVERMAAAEWRGDLT